MNQVTSGEPVRIFIGSSPKNYIEEKVFRYTLQKNARCPIEIHVINGQNGSATNLNTGEVKELPPNIIGRIKGATAFSLARWAIPQWCGYEGKAIYCDSDQVALADIDELWNYDLSGNILSAVPVRKAKSYKHYTDHFLGDYLNSDDEYYLASVMLMDCKKAEMWSLESLIELIDQKAFTFADLMYLGKGFRTHFGFEVKPLPSEWNHLDYADPGSKIVHFTDLTSQPWRFHHHPISALWEEIFLESIEQGFLTKEEVVMACSNGWVTRRIKSLAFMGKRPPEAIHAVWRVWSSIILSIAQFLEHQVKRVKFVLSRLNSRSSTINSAQT